MPVVEITNRTDRPVSTSIGIVLPGPGRTISRPMDVVPKALIEELESFRSRRAIEFKVVQDPGINDEIELRAIGKPAAVTNTRLFVDAVQGNDQSRGNDFLNSFKTLQVALDQVPLNTDNFVVEIYVGAGSYSGILKGIRTANNATTPEIDTFSEPYSFLFDPTKNGVVRFIGNTTPVLVEQVAVANFKSIQVSSNIFVPNEHIGRLVRILDGNAKGELALIKSNTLNELEVDFFFNAPELGDNFEIVDRNTTLNLDISNCDGLTLIDSCNINLNAKFADKVGLTHCKGSIAGKSSRISAIYHFMNLEDTVNLYASMCEFGFGSLLYGVERQIAEYFSVYALMETRLRQCGVAGTHIGTQDFLDGFGIFGRHGSQVSLYDTDVDDGLASLLVLVSSHGWVGFSSIGVGVPQPNHIVECYLNSTYNDAGGNVFNSILDNILLESGSSSVDSIGDSDSSGVKRYANEAILLSDSPDNGVIGFAILEGSYWLRSFDTWFEYFTPPQPPLTLVGQSLVFAGSTLYSAKIPTGLSSAWSLLSPGSTITNYVVDGTFTLDSPDPTNTFLAGTVLGGQPSAGILGLVENAVVVESYDIGINGVGTIGRITITALVNHNVIFQRANARFTIVLTIEGRNRFAMQHSESGMSVTSEYYFDDINTVPSFLLPLSASVNTLVPKYLSGIAAIGLSSTIDVAYTAASGIFRKAYHPTAVGTISGNGVASTDDNPIATPDVNDTLPVSRTVIVDQPNQGVLAPQATATIRKSNGAQALSSDLYGQPLNTYGIVSTGKDDRFFDEARRIVLNSGTTSGTATSWTSSSVLANGNAQQRHSGILQFPDAVDYPGFSGDQEYQRFFDKAGASIGQLTFQNILYSAIAAYGTGNLNILLHLAVQNLFFDLGRPIGSDNGSGDGSTRGNSIGARNDSLSSGGVLAWSVGIYSTAFNNNEYRLIVIFKNTTSLITRITEA